MIPPLVRSAALAVLLPLAAATLRAQDTTHTQPPDTIVIERPTVIVPRSALSPAPIHRNLFSIQPLNAMFESYQAEYERTLSRTATVGIGGSLWHRSDVDYRSGEIKFRYYPGARALQGFSFGVSGGYTRMNVEDSDFRMVHGATMGALFEYNWLLGPEQKFHVGMGLGAKTIFGRKDDFFGDANWHYPTARISIGWAF